MNVATRFMRSFGTVMPYAQWAPVLIQLGYYGYGALKWYMMYREQRERDTRNGVFRSDEEIIEYIVSPRRRRVRGDYQEEGIDEGAQQAGVQQQQQQQPGSNINQQQSSDNINQQQATSSETPTNSIKYPNLNDLDRSFNGNENAQNSVATIENRTIEIIDVTDEPAYNQIEESSRHVAMIGEAGPSGLSQREQSAGRIDDRLETISNASTSLESTDSNKGIVKNIYTECFICATSLDNPRKQVATLPFCMHPFHKSCLDGVLKWHPKCPVCDFHIYSPI